VTNRRDGVEEVEVNGWRARENMRDELRERENKDFSANHDRIILTHQKLRIKLTKDEYDRIRNRFKLSFPFGAPNNLLNHDRILLSYHVFLSCAPNDPLKNFKGVFGWRV